MPFSRSGRYYTIRATRWCRNCDDQTEQMALSGRYGAPDEPRAPSVLIKTIDWHCERCEQVEQEVKEVTEPTDRLRIIRRFLSLSDDYVEMYMLKPDMLLTREQFTHKGVHR